MSAAPVGVESFDALMARVLPSPELCNGPLAVALSGGVDSITLTLLLKNWCAARGIPLIALTVDHGLRPESASEAATLAQWCKTHNIPHEILRWHPKATPNRAIQAQARAARYELLAERCHTLGAYALLTAHHRDDQVETFFFRLARGSGLDGLACMRPASTLPCGLPLLRPLLPVSKAALQATVLAANEPWLEDPSNQKSYYTRNHIRQQLRAHPHYEALAERTYHLCESLGNIRNLLEYNTASHSTKCLSWVDTSHTTVATLALAPFIATPPVYRERILAQLVQKLGTKEHKPRSEKLERLHSALLDSERPHNCTLSGLRFLPPDGGIIRIEHILPPTP
jgi:tRNA(Ile)-lysidine synthase